MNGEKAAKVTVSLPRRVLDIVDRLASEKSATRSSIIVGLVEQAEEAKLQQLMAEGYAGMAEENRRLAEESFPDTVRDISKYTQWDEKSG